MNAKEIVEYFIAVASAIGMVFAAMIFFRKVVMHDYGLERDINHLKRNHHQLSEYVKELDDELEKLREKTTRDRAILYTLAATKGIPLLDQDNE